MIVYANLNQTIIYMYYYCVIKAIVLPMYIKYKNIENTYGIL